jgi:hypothetical protein
MFFLVYVSSAVKLFSKSALVDLLNQSREKNYRLAITGMLLYKDGNFMQVLEGDETAVRGLHATIARDPRHRGVTTILEGPLADRSFPDWSMGFRDLNSPEVLQLPGFNEFLNTRLSEAEFSNNPSACQKLLLMFKRYM